MGNTKLMDQRSKTQQTFQTAQAEHTQEAAENRQAEREFGPETVRTEQTEQSLKILENSLEEGNIRKNAVPVLTGKELRELEKRRQEQEEQRKEIFAGELALMDKSERYSAKKRKGFMSASEELNQKAEKERERWEREKNKPNVSKGQLIEIEEKIIKLESDARKEYSKALSLSNEQEEYLLQTEELRRLNSLQRLYGRELQDEQLDEKMKKLEGERQKARDQLIKNKEFLEFRQRVVSKALEQSADKDMESVFQKAKEIFGEDEIQLISREDFIQEMEQALETPETAQIDEMMENIEQYKERLGGAPNYGDEKPRLAREFMREGGHSLENRRAWARKLIERGNIFQKAYGWYLNKKYGSDQPESDYERASLYLHSMRNLALYKPFILSAYEEDKNRQREALNHYSEEDRRKVRVYQGVYAQYHKGHDMMLELTRVSCHNNLNGAGVEMNHIENVLFILVQQYNLAKQENRLEDFYKNLDGACFDDRVGLLMEYAQSHPIEGEIPDMEEEELEAPKDGSMYIQKKSVVDAMQVYDQMSVLQVASKILQALAVTYGLNMNEAPPTWAEIEPEIKRRMSGKKFMDIDEEGMENGKQIEVDDAVLTRVKQAMIQSYVIDE
ncbi:MAG: hypothetical protein Q4C65_03580 [Eubacteriales bacterium]|nr:hypothetical protein [Eubacteriales bacterium]